MKKGVVHSKDNKRTYIATYHKNVDSHEHAKHLIPGKRKMKILPSKYKKHHDHFEIGDKVMFEIHKIDNTLIMTFYFGLPILGLILGLAIGNIVAKTEVGVLLYMIMFMLLGINLKYIMWKDFNVFREIDVKINKPTSKVELYKAKKGIRKNKSNPTKKATRKKVSKVK